MATKKSIVQVMLASLKDILCKRTSQLGSIFHVIFPKAKHSKPGCRKFHYTFKWAIWGHKVNNGRSGDNRPHLRRRIMRYHPTISYKKVAAIFLPWRHRPKRIITPVMKIFLTSYTNRSTQHLHCGTRKNDHVQRVSLDSSIKPLPVDFG